MIELLKYMDLALDKDEEEEEREREKIWINYLSLVYSQRPEGKENPGERKERKEFIEAINPASSENEAKKHYKKPPKQVGPAKVYEWDLEHLRKIKEQQQKGRRVKK